MTKVQKVIFSLEAWCNEATGEIFCQSADGANSLRTEVLKTKEKLVHESLIELGWTPPQEKFMKLNEPPFMEKEKRQACQELENAIEKLLNHFQQKTGIRVESLFVEDEQYEGNEPAYRVMGDFK